MSGPCPCALRGGISSSALIFWWREWLEREKQNVWVSPGCVDRIERLFDKTERGDVSTLVLYLSEDERVARSG